LRDLVHRELAQHNYESIANSKGITKKRYDIGTCVYLEQPLGHAVRIIFAAIASDREPRGMRADLSTIFKAVEEIKCKVANERLATVFVPLLGSGKGGVPGEVAFLTLISALLEARCREGGHHLKEMHVVVFQGSGKNPQLLPTRARRGLRQLVTLYQEMST